MQKDDSRIELPSTYLEEGLFVILFVELLGGMFVVNVLTIADSGFRWELNLWRKI